LTFSVAKSHVGGILARLLAVPGIRLVGARVLFPSRTLQKEFYQATKAAFEEDGVVERYEGSTLEYLEKVRSDDYYSQEGIQRKVMLLLFAGKNTREKLAATVGDNIPPPEEYGRTIRGTYGDYSTLMTGEVLTFEPAVLIPHTDKSNREKLAILAKYAETDGGVMVSLSLSLFLFIYTFISFFFASPPLPPSQNFFLSLFPFLASAAPEGFHLQGTPH